MEIQGHNGQAGSERRQTARRSVSVSGRITWKDARGAIRFASVRTRDVSDEGAYVECLSGSPIPLYRLVHLQIDQAGQTLPAGVPPVLGRGKVLSAVYRVAPSQPTTGLPAGYALRLLVPPLAAGRSCSRFTCADADQLQASIA